MTSADHRLAVYGSLGPGKPNHHHLAMIDGAWTTGTVRGHLQQQGWGAAMGFPGIVLDPDGPEVPVDLLTSADLPGHWARLDDFEGEGYQRVITPVRTADGDVEASVYALRPGRVT